MSWRKAIEKLPEEGKNVPIKVNGEYDLGWYSFSESFQTLSHGRKDIQLIEWLDESSNDYVYAIYEGSIYEGGGVIEVYKDEEKAIKFALMNVDEKNKKAFEIHHGKSKNWDNFQYKEEFFDFPAPHICKIWSNKINDVIVYKYKIL